MNDTNRHGILDIPDITLLSVTTVDELISMYQRRLGTKPESISLPVTSCGGLTYESSLGIPNVAPEIGGGRKYDLKRLVEETASYGLTFYFTINPTLPFATTSSDYNLVDSVGDETPKCCVVNPFTQEAIKEIIKESYEIACRLGVSPTGYVLIIQDLWPMSAKGERLELTCFCKHCRAALSGFQGLELGLFERSPNPWNLALKDTGSGISHLNEICEGDQPLQILAKSKERDFYSSSWFSVPEQEERWARQLYLYVHGRDEITRNAINNIKSAVPEGVKTILMADTFDYGWTAGMFLTTVQQIGDIVWLPPRGLLNIALSPNIAFYMVGRGRYIVDALFEHVHFVTRVARLDPTGSATDMPDLRLNFVSRASKLLAALHFSRMEIIPVQRSGYNFVVPVITDELVKRMMEQLGLHTVNLIQQFAQLAEFLRKYRE